MSVDRSASALDATTSLSLATVRPDGRPHVVPLWFIWDGDTIVAFSKPHAQKVRNLVAEPRAMVSVGQPGAADASLIEVVAEVEAGGATVLADRFAAKYHHHVQALGLTVDQFVETYPIVIRLRPTRWLSWGGPGWIGRDSEHRTADRLPSEPYALSSTPIADRA